jgi:ArsR family transcriptional regulator
MRPDQRTALSSPGAGERVAEFFRVLAEPSRLHLVRALTLKCKAVSILVAETGLAQPLVSHHLRVLKDAGIARAERRGSFVFY